MNLSVDQIYKVKVIKIIKADVIVELEDKSTQLIHISNIANSYIASIDAYVSVGDVFDAMAVPSSVKGVELSLKHLNLKNRDPAASEETAAKHTRKPNKYKPSEQRSTNAPKRSVDSMIEDLRKSDDSSFDYHRRDKSIRDKRRKNNNRRRDR